MRIPLFSKWIIKTPPHGRGPSLIEVWGPLSALIDARRGIHNDHTKGCVRCVMWQHHWGKMDSCLSYVSIKHRTFIWCFHNSSVTRSARSSPSRSQKSPLWPFSWWNKFIVLPTIDQRRLFSYSPWRGCFDSFAAPTGSSTQGCASEPLVTKVSWSAVRSATIAVYYPKDYCKT